MANWCSNTVEFIGEHSQIEGLEKLFRLIAEKEKETNQGQLPPFGSFEKGWLFDVRWEGGILYYETKWSPNTEVITGIANHFKVGLSYSYSEPGNCVYGEAHYSNGDLTTVDLDWRDTDLYEFEGQDYESSEEICEILLERKKNALAQIAALNASNSKS